MENMHEPVMMDAPEFIGERMSLKLIIWQEDSEGKKWLEDDT